MFGLFSKKKSLQKKYEQLLKEAYLLSTKDRTLSDAKTAEADKVLEELKKIEESEK